MKRFSDSIVSWAKNVHDKTGTEEYKQFTDFEIQLAEIIIQAKNDYDYEEDRKLLEKIVDSV